MSSRTGGPHSSVGYHFVFCRCVPQVTLNHWYIWYHRILILFLFRYHNFITWWALRSIKHQTPVTFHLVPGICLPGTYYLHAWYYGVLIIRCLVCFCLYIKLMYYYYSCLSRGGKCIILSCWELGPFPYVRTYVCNHTYVHTIVSPSANRRES